MRLISSMVLCLMSLVAIAQIPQASSGIVKRTENFGSQFGFTRNIEVWLPEGYSSNKQYAVLYMHDGQMLYDSTTSWNKSAWDVDDVITSLSKKKKIKDVIVVGVWNDPKTRHADYFPQKPFESLRSGQQDSVYLAARPNGVSLFNDHKIRSDSYLKFLVLEVKPFIDKTYSTRSDRANTFVMGSSMGGLISMYAICEYPEIFGGAGCLSTHWPGIFQMDNNPIPGAFENYMRAHLPDPKSHKIYFDYGTATLDALYPPLQKKVDGVMTSKGFSKKNWKTMEFPGAEHTERAWRKRLDIPLTFLLKK